jgi:hypothetical protein
MSPRKALSSRAKHDAHEVNAMRSRKPALSEAEGDPYPCTPSSALQGISTTGRVGRTLPSASSGQALSVAFDVDFEVAFDVGSGLAPELKPVFPITRPSLAMRNRQNGD